MSADEVMKSIFKINKRIESLEEERDKLLDKLYEIIEEREK